MKFKLLTLLTGFLFVTSFVTKAQLYDPVDWEFEVEHIEGDIFEIRAKATVEEHWHIYTTDEYGDSGPIPTSMNVDGSDDIELVGEVTESGNLIEKYEEVFEATLKYYDGNATFKQRVKALSEGASATGYVNFMVCKDEMCLPPTDIDFDLKLTKPAPKEAIKTEEEAVEKLEESEQEELIEEDDRAKVLEESEVVDEPMTGAGGMVDPVKWSFDIKKLGNGNYELHFIAEIEEGWHLYDTEIDDGGPIPTSFNYDSDAGFKLISGLVKNGELIESFDDQFEMNVGYFENQVTFTQEVKPEADMTLKGYVEFMACNDRMCTPPVSEDFTFNLSGEGSVSGDKKAGDIAGSNTGKRDNLLLNTVDLENPAMECGTDAEAASTGNKGIWGIFILGFLGGLVALLTPCVFPMIPLTVSFFTKGTGESKGIGQALLYGFFIFFIYIIVSLPFHLINGLQPEILNTIATHWILNLIFFVIFVVFAASFFGYFEMTLPSSLANKVDSASNIGGIFGTFFMALTLAIVSFSCTGPILGSLLVGALASPIKLTYGLAGFGLALALPFALFAMFPGMLKSLPKSGGWLNTVKVNFAFIELALAIKFLSNADLVEHWGFLKREIFFALWIIIGIGWLLYLLGVIRFPHDPPKPKMTPLRWAIAGLVAAFIIYLLPGVTNTDYANRKLLSGFPPPLFYSIYEKENQCPLGIDCYKDYDEGLAAARAENKPILLDFTGWACVNCRKMEENVWVKPEIYEILNNDVVLISLYVDDTKKLPEDEQFTYETKSGNSRKIRTIGNKWATFQAENFHVNSQPYYVIISPNEKLLTHPIAYSSSKDFKQFLECGISGYTEAKQDKLVSSK